MGKIFFNFNAYRIRMLCNINISPLLIILYKKSGQLSTYTYELFSNEIIHGYKGLKILISLTPKTLFAHINIQYTEKQEVNDDIENIFAEHFKERFTRNKANFISKLNEEKDKTPKGKLIYTENNRRIYNIDILKDDYNFPSLNNRYKSLEKNSFGLSYDLNKIPNFKCPKYDFSSNNISLKDLFIKRSDSMKNEFFVK